MLAAPVSIGYAHLDTHATPAERAQGKWLLWAWQTSLVDAMKGVLEFNYPQKMDPFAFFDFSAELDLARQIRKDPSNIDPSWFQTKDDLGEIDFRK